MDNVLFLYIKFKQILCQCFTNCRAVHSVCLWDDRGPKKVHQALEDDILEFIKHAQNVSALPLILTPWKPVFVAAKRIMEELSVYIICSAKVRMRTVRKTRLSFILFIGKKYMYTNHCAVYHRL